MDLFAEYALKNRPNELMAKAAEVGTDVHTYVASEVLGISVSQVTEVDRQKSKVAFFAAFYGSPAK